MPRTRSWWRPPPAGCPSSRRCAAASGAPAHPARSRRAMSSTTEGSILMFENFDWIRAMRNSPVMLIILACSVVTLGFAIERAIYYWKRRGNAEPILSQALDRVRAGSPKEAAFTCFVAPHPFGPVAAEVLKSGHLPADAQ